MEAAVLHYILKELRWLASPRSRQRAAPSRRPPRSSPPTACPYACCLFHCTSLCHLCNPTTTTSLHLLINECDPSPLQVAMRLDQLTVNEYESGVGLSPHIDTHSAFTGEAGGGRGCIPVTWAGLRVA